MNNVFRSSGVPLVRRRLHVGVIAAIAAVLSAVSITAPADAAQARLSANPASVDCGTQVVRTGFKLCPTATLTNTSSGTVNVVAVNTRGDTTEIGAGTDCTGPLAPGESCNLITTFSPSETGRARVTVSVFDDNGVAVRVRVFGLGIAA
jgi:hypothetical protein